MKVDNFPNGTPLVFHIFSYLCLSNVLGPLDETPHLSSCPNPPGSELCLSLQAVSAGGYELSGQSFSLWKTLENQVVFRQLLVVRLKSISKQNARHEIIHRPAAVSDWKVLFLFLFVACTCSYAFLLRLNRVHPPHPPALHYYYSYSYSSSSCSYSVLVASETVYTALQSSSCTSHRTYALT